jgi:hypothetical protein
MLLFFMFLRKERNSIWLANAVIAELIPPEGVEERLARTLHEKMEHLDPRGETWDSLSERDKDFYRCCIERILVSGLVKVVSTME